MKHTKRWEPVGLVKTEIFDRAVPWTRLILRHRRMDNDLNLGWANRIAGVLVFTLLATLVAAVAWPWLLVASLFASVGLITIDARLARFFVARRGLRFGVRGIAFHWFYYLYSGLGLGLGVGAPRGGLAITPILAL